MRVTENWGVPTYYTPTVKTLYPIRWRVRTAAIQLCFMYKLLIEVNESGRDEYTMKAGGYLSTMDKFSTFLVSNNCLI